MSILKKMLNFDPLCRPTALDIIVELINNELFLSNYE